MKCAAAILIFSALLCSASEWYVATNGSAGGAGTIGDPLDLWTAFTASNTIVAGDTIFLRAGTYGSGGATSYSNHLRGTSGNRITIKSYTNEFATIDGGIWSGVGLGDKLNGAYITYENFRITNTSTNRWIDSQEVPQLRQPGLTLYGYGCKAINLVIDNTGHPAIFMADLRQGGEIYGCLMFHNGIYDTNNYYQGYPRGSAIYANNEDGTNHLRHNVAWMNWDSGYNLYTSSGYMNDWEGIQNVVFGHDQNNVRIRSGSNIATNILWLGNHSFNTFSSGAGAKIGDNATQGDIIFSTNYSFGGSGASYELHPVGFQHWTNTTMQGNKLVSGRVVYYAYDATTNGSTVDNNSYYSPFSTPFTTDFDVNDPLYTLSEWQGVTGWDSNSTFSSTWPASTETFFWTNDYDPDRGLIVVWNWESNNTVSVDVSDLLTSGDSYELKDSQNYFGDLAGSGTYDGVGLDVPMNLTAIASPVGENEAGSPPLTNSHTSVLFNAFILNKTTDAPQEQQGQSPGRGWGRNDRGAFILP